MRVDSKTRPSKLASCAAVALIVFAPVVGCQDGLREPRRRVVAARRHRRVLRPRRRRIRWIRRAADEIRVAIQVVKGDARFAGAVFPSVAVQDPPQSDVLAWQPGQPFARTGEVQAMTAAGFHELLVDSTTPADCVCERTARRRAAGDAVRVRSREGRPDESRIPRRARRNAASTDLDEALLLADDRRLLRHSRARRQAPHQGRMLSTLRRTTTNMWGWPIERLYAMVDLRERKVLSVADGGVVPDRGSGHELHRSGRRRRCAPRASRR